ncbi:MAG TPA: hypothetical protein VK427_20220 [Kofleriaceae bacterium]|nr:hypothetical protein [Kofleriaceae bacterium]
MRRIAIACALLCISASARAQGKDDEEGEEEDDEEGEGAKPASKPAAKEAQREFKKQDLRGHDVDAKDIANPFQKDRFFVDKVDTEKTEDATLVQGSLQWSNFAYTESSGDIPAAMGQTTIGSAASKYARFFTDLRSQTDFRHIAGGRWDGRIDMRGRYVTDPSESSVSSVDDTRIQSGFNGEPELELRETWLVRSGKRSDVFIGRQFVPDLGAIKIDGLRIDYASSEKLTFVGFGGLYPVRGSRSLSTDYPKLRTSDGTGTGNLQDAGRLVTAGGFGTAYRTIDMHGAIGGVAIVPLSSERPRVYATSNGYYRTGPSLDLYHYVILDLFGAAADPIALTNLSVGANYKPGQRLRLTASFNRVDTETLNVQAGAFLQDPIIDDAGASTKVQNDTFIQLQRISTNAARGSLSVGLGELNRFELTVAAAYRYRPEITLTPVSKMMAIKLNAAKGVDVFGGIMDRRSLFDLRIGIDGSRSIAVGDTAFSRTESTTFRGFAAREIRKGRGDVEAEVSYVTSIDRSGAMSTACVGSAVSPADCFGASDTKVLTVGGQVYYRLKDNLFGIANLWVSRVGLKRKDGMEVLQDPTITSITGFVRLAYRY